MTSRSPARRPPAACTIVSRNFLSYARVLANSYARHEPGGRFYLLVVDGLPDGAEVGADVCLLGPEDLALPYFYEMCFEYDVAELCTAIKPSVLLLLFNRFREEEVIFFDPDILILRPLEELREPLASASIVLTPNLMKPLPLDGKRPIDQDILIAGTFNLGFIALRRSEQALEFLRWWEERLRNGGAVVDVPKGLMTDQKWVDLAPTLFPDTVIFRDDTYNVAWWNIHHREVTRRGEQFLVNGRPLTFYHFSGFSPARPGVFTKECENRTKLTEGTALADLFRLYVDLHMKNGFAETGKWQYRYSRFDNGVVVNLLLRRLYLDLSAAERAPFGDPFRTGGPDSFFAWATRPQPAEGNLSPFLLSLYRVRFDLAAEFPDVRGKHREAFLEWAWAHGSREMGYDPELMRVQDAMAAAGGGEGNGAAAQAAGARGAGEGRLPPRHVRRYQHLVQKIREVAHAVLPPDAAVLVVSKGDDELLQLLELDGRRAWHFPQTDDGEYAGHNPATSGEAVAHLEALRQKGADFLLIPDTALWWLGHYTEFKRHLEAHYRVIVDLEDVCLIVALGNPGAGEPGQAFGTAAAAPPAALRP
jgi:hypothetical protein